MAQLGRHALASLVLVLVVLAFLASCSASSATTFTPTHLERGEALYQQSCASQQCHGTDGEGRRSGSQFVVWPLVGDDFQRRNPNAQVMFDVVRSGDEPSLRKLTDQDIYDAVAYELTQNSIDLAQPLTRDNASTVSGGTMQGEVGGGLFPPPDNVTLDQAAVPFALPRSASSDALYLQIDQFARAQTIAGKQSPTGGSFVILVLMLEDRTTDSMQVGPDFLRLTTVQSSTLTPAKTGIHSAIETFHHQTLQPDHGTAALVVFALPAQEEPAQLIYDDGSGEPLTVSLQP